MGLYAAVVMISFLKPFPSIGQIEPYAFRHPSYPEWIFWLTMPTATFKELSEHQVAELATANWQKADAFPIEMRLCAASQLSPTLLTRQAEATIEETWINMDDLQYAEQYPVLLAFLTPPRLNGEEMLHSLSLRNLAIGRDALVFHEETSSHYILEQLGSDARRLYMALHHNIYMLSRLENSEHLPEAVSSQTGTYLKDADLNWPHTQQIAKQLAQLYWDLHQQQKQAASSLHSIPKPAAFQQQSVALIPSSLALQGALAAYSNAQSSKGSGWRQDARKPMYLHQRAKDYAQVEWKPAENPSFSPANLEMLWKQIRAFNDHDGDVLLCLLAHWIAVAKDPDGYTWITADHLLTYRGIQPRTYIASDGTKHLQSYRQENLEEISISIEHIRNTHVTVRQWTQVEQQEPKRRGRPRKHIIQLESYLLTITDFLQQHTLLASQDPSPNHFAIAWRYRPGTCIEALLDKQLASLFQQALAYDPYREQWEKRLARYFTFHLYGQGNTDTITRKLSDIIDELSLPINTSEQDKTRKRFEKAMKRLCEDHLIARWDYVEDTANLPSQRWLAVWLSYHIQVVPVSPTLSPPDKRPRSVAMPDGKEEDD